MNNTEPTVRISCDTLMRIKLYLKSMADLYEKQIKMSEEVILAFCDHPNDIAFASAVTSYKNEKKDLDRVLALITQIDATEFLKVAEESVMKGE